MKPQFKYLYANFLCKTLEQYINIIICIHVALSLLSENMEGFWNKYKITSGQKPKADWNRDQPIKKWGPGKCRARHTKNRS